MRPPRTPWMIAVLLSSFILPWIQAPAWSQCPCPCPADTTGNTLRDGLDVDDFVRCILGGPSVGPGCGCADLNADSTVDLVDMPLFANTLLAPGPCGVALTQYEPGPLDTPPASPCREGRSCGGRADAGSANSIYFFAGEFYQSVTDLRIRGRGPDFTWARKYRSKNGPNTAMGNGWDFSYDLYIEAAGADRILHDGNTRADLYPLQANGKWARDEFFRELQLNGDSTYTLIFADTGKWDFRSLTNPIAPGRIASIVDRNSNTISFAYDAQGRLSTITDTLSRNIIVAYNADGFISTVTDFTGRQVVYSYYTNIDAGGAFGDLKSVRSPTVVGTPNGNDYPSGKTTLYTYSKGFADNRLNHNLLTVTDPKGQTYLQNVYASVLDPADLNFDRLIRQTWGNPGDLIDVSYVAQSACSGNNFAAIKAMVNDRDGDVKEFFYNTGNQLVMSREYTGRADPDLATTESANRPVAKLRPSDPDYFETRWTYNADAMPTQITYPNLNTTVNTYELALDPSAARRTRGNLRQVTRNPGPLGGDQAQICQSATYDPGHNFSLTLTDGRGSLSVQTRDAAGNCTQLQHRIPTIFTNWEYNTHGQVTACVRPDNGSAHRCRNEFFYYAAGPQTGYLQTVTVDAGGLNLVTADEHDAVGNVTRRTDPRGHDTLFVVNALNQVVRKTSREVTGGSIRYSCDQSYDLLNNPVQVNVRNIDDQGVLQPNTDFTTTIDYDILNFPIRRTREVDVGLQVVEEIDYDANRNPILIRLGEATNGNQPTNTITFVPDERDLLLKEIRALADANQSTTQFNYDPNGNLITTLQGLEDTPRVTLSTFDGYDRGVTFTDPMGNVTTRHLDANGNIVSVRHDGELVDVVGAAANVRLYEAMATNDAEDRTTSIVRFWFDPATQVLVGDGQRNTQIDYSDNSQVLSVTDDLGRVWLIAYDGANRAWQRTDPKNDTVTLSFDANSAVTFVTVVGKSDLGNPDLVLTKAIDRDNLERAISMTDSAGNTTQRRYDSRHNPTVLIDALGNPSITAFDGLGRPTSRTQPLTDTGSGSGTPIGAITTTKTWNDDSRLKVTTDSTGSATIRTYDAVLRLNGMVYADGTQDQTVWDVHHNVVQTIDANNTVINGTYDLNNRLTNTAITPGPGVSGAVTAETVQWDGRSFVATAKNNNWRVTRARDSLGNLTTETQQSLPAGLVRIVSGFFNDVGNLIRLVYPGGRAIVFQRDSLNRVVAILDDPPAGLPIVTIFYLGRDPERYKLANNIQFDAGFDPIGRMMHGLYQNVISGTIIDERFYGYNANNSKTQELNPSSFPPDNRYYQYTSANWLKHSERPAAALTIDYFMNNAGNWINVIGGDGTGPYVSDQMHQYTDTPRDHRNYDAKGNTKEINEIAPAVNKALTYNCYNQLTNFQNATTGSTVTYKHDVLGRLTEKDVNGTITKYYYLGDAVIEEQNIAGATQATYVAGDLGAADDILRTVNLTGKDRDWRNEFHRDYCNAILQMKRGANTNYYLCNAQRDVVALTDDTGTVAQRNAYGDYGQTIPAVPTTFVSQPPNQVNVRASDFDPIPPPKEAADNFSVIQPGVSINSVRWWGAYLGGPPPPSDQFTIKIYQDAGGLPGALVFQANPTATRTGTGQFVAGLPEFKYEAALSPAFHPLQFTPYWGEIANNVPGPVFWGWESGLGGNGNSASRASAGPWLLQAGDQAFELISAPVSTGNPYLFHSMRWDPDTGLYLDGSRGYDPNAGCYTTRHPGGPWAVAANVGNPNTFAQNNPATLQVSGLALTGLKTQVSPGILPSPRNAVPYLPGSRPSSETVTSVSFVSLMARLQVPVKITSISIPMSSEGPSAGVDYSLAFGFELPISFEGKPITIVLHETAAPSSLVSVGGYSQSPNKVVMYTADLINAAMDFKGPYIWATPEGNEPYGAPPITLEEETPPPTAPAAIDLLSPTFGAEGTQLTITGNGFDPNPMNTEVFVGGIGASVWTPGGLASTFDGRGPLNGSPLTFALLASIPDPDCPYVSISASTSDDGAGEIGPPTLQGGGCGDVGKCGVTGLEAAPILWLCLRRMRRNARRPKDR